MAEDQPGETALTSTRQKIINDEKVSFFKLFSFADRSDVVLMILGSIGAIANGLAQPLMTVIFGQVINSFGTSSNQDVVHEISQVCPKYVYLAVGAGIAATLQVSCWMVAGERQATRIRGMYLKAILRQDITFFDTEATTGEVIGRMSGDTITIQDAMGEKVGKFLQLSSTFIGGFVVAFIKGWRLAIILTSITPLLVLFGGAMGMITSSMISRAQAAYAKAGQVVEQTVGGIRTVQSFTGEKQAISKYDDNITIAYKATCFQGLVSGLALGSICLIFFGSYGLAVWYGSKLIIHNGYNGGRIINVIFAIMTGGMSLGQTAPCLSAFASGRAAAYKMIETSKRKPKIDVYDTTGVVLEDIKGDIELKDVYFRYPARPDIQIFSGFSIYIPSGSTAALVGHSGSGKSTVISLLERFYDPDSGQLLVDGVNLKTMRLKWIREKMGLVSQEPILFAGTIKENIAYGKENATDEEIQSAIELANAVKFLNKLPKGLDTMVGEHGTALSGGQKQRIAIARAIIKNPRILLLDEATSALDTESERVVQKALDTVMADRTTVVVAHRLTTIRHADIIAVVHAGKLEQQGTHDELIKDPNGAYSQLVQMQMGSKQAEETTGVETDKEETVPEIYRSLSRRMPSRKSTGSRTRVGIIDENEVVDKTETDEKNKGGRKDISLMRLASLNKPELPVLLLGSIAASIHGLVFPIFGLLLSTAIKIFFEPPHELRKDSKHWALMFFYFGIVTFVVIPVQNYFFGVAGGKLIQRIRSLSFAKITHQDISWFDDPANSSGALGARLSTDASTMRSLVGDDLAIKVQNISTIISGLVIAFTANWILAIIILVLLPLIGLQGFLQMKFYKGFSADAKAMYEEASSVANDAVGSIRTVASFCAEEKIMDMYQKKCEAPLKAGIKLGIGSGVGFGFGAFALYCTYSLCFYIGSVLQEHEKATFAEIFKVFFALTMTAMGVSQAAGLTPDLNKAKDAAASIFQILDSKPKIDSSSDDGTTLATVKGDIELQHVSFKYPTRPDIQIFKDMCLTIPAGKTVALVGESGSGKSTVISLIERFYDPDSGHVYLDGVAIKMLKLSWLRQQMGLVSQEPILFNETIRSNITYGKKGVATEEEIIEATTAANAHSFISSLPQGYDTSVGERGVQLSGGQKQRIAIARAILKDPRILLLDEATSALDAESERVVQNALERVMVNRTSVVIAHRLATIKGADVIAVVKDGVIAEKGNHDSLMNVTDGLYASMLALHTSST